MGESSTFGFYDRDDYTYPAILERLLTEELSKGRVEVINVGIPHADSDNLLAMLKGELLSYQPGLITIYAGFNDVGQVIDASVLQQTLRWFHGHVATYVALKRLVSALGGPELYSRWASYGSGGGDQEAYVRRQIELHLERFDRNIREIVVLVKQALDIVDNRKKKKATSMTYKEEVAQVAEHLQKREVISANEVILLVHSALMERLEVIAREKHLSTVDNIVIADAHPEYFASYVHLTEDGNQALAQAMSSAIGGFVSRQSAPEALSSGL
jgi:lysophospholipase L1-like esterase